MEIPGVAALWTVGSFLLGQGVVFGGLLINNRAQARREQEARDAERRRTHAERREAFELAHLQDLHAELTELLLVAEPCIHLWRDWHQKLLDAHHERDTPAKRERRDKIKASATEQERIAKLHLEKINRLAGLVIPTPLRARVYSAHGQYEFVLQAVVNDEVGHDEHDLTPADLTLATAQLHLAQAQVAARIRDIYVSAENLPGSTAVRR